MDFRIIDMQRETTIDETMFCFISEVSGVWDGRSLQSLFNKVWNLWGLSMNASLFAVAILNFVHFEMGLPMGKKHRRCTKFHGPRSSGRMFCPKPSAMMFMIGAESWKNSECHPGFTLEPRQQTRRSLAKKKRRYCTSGALGVHNTGWIEFVSRSYRRQTSS